MRTRKQRHLSPAGFVLALILLILAIFALDALYRLFTPAKTDHIVGTGGFSSTASSSADNETPPDEPAETEEPAPEGTVLQLTASDMANGSLILVDAAHPYAGGQVSSTFASVTSENVKPKDTSLAIQTEIAEPLCSLFDGYAAANGYSNLQIYSTLSNTLNESSLYTNSLPDRDSGYAFDIGLITSTGEVVPYLTKRNEWMVTNAWQYGFVLRYPEDKTEITGVSYAPHHFRYVGKIHAAIMHENNFCLEEYLDYLQNYTIESGGLSYSDGVQSYLLYYIPGDISGSATVQLPENISYSISGDNRGGFILTISGDAIGTADGAAAENSEAPAE